MCMSVPHTPAKRTRRRISPGPGRGFATWRSSSPSTTGAVLHNASITLSASDVVDIHGAVDDALQEGHFLGLDFQRTVDAHQFVVVPEAAHHVADARVHGGDDGL